MTRRAGETGNKSKAGFERALARAFAASGGVPAVERETGIKAKRLYAAQDPDSDGRQKELTVIELRRIARVSPDAALILAEEFAALAGASVVALPADDHSTGWHVAAVLRAQAEVMAALDGERRAEARAHANDLIAAAMALSGALLRGERT